MRVQRVLADWRQCSRGSMVRSKYQALGRRRSGNSSVFLHQLFTAGEGYCTHQLSISDTFHRHIIPVSCTILATSQPLKNRSQAHFIMLCTFVVPMLMLSTTRCTVTSSKHIAVISNQVRAHLRSFLVRVIHSILNAEPATCKLTSYACIPLVFAQPTTLNEKWIETRHLEISRVLVLFSFVSQLTLLRFPKSSVVLHHFQNTPLAWLKPLHQPAAKEQGRWQWFTDLIPHLDVF